jgi:L-cysteine/cystine lyase
VLSLVDAAQSVGAIALDLPASGVDFYAMSGQKWLCGPEGTGALYVRRDRLSLAAPTFVGYKSMGDAARYDYTGYFMPSPDARRYELATIYRPGLKAMIANLTWLADTMGWEWIYARIARLAAYAHDALSRLPGVRVITPPGPQAGLITFTLEGYDPARVMTRLAQADIVLRFIDQPYALRISTGFYNTEGDIDRLIDALRDILAQNPDMLPLYE